MTTVVMDDSIVDVNLDRSLTVRYAGTSRIMEVLL